ncbi:formylglycine-generating enzyme family protein [bacterium]|nr:formylglycine-generating enzyme family protein [bacterium]
MVYVEPGSFMMGSPKDEKARFDNKGIEFDVESQQKVTITRRFHVQKTPVTVKNWRTFVEDTGYLTEAETEGAANVWTETGWKTINGAFWDNQNSDQSDLDPVTFITWNDTLAFLGWLNRKEKIKGFQLPTEAEWEYACRAETTTRYFFGDDQSRLREFTWYNEDSHGRTHPVAKLKPNSFGLYDIHGNVWEWCRDWYDRYQVKNVVNPEGPLSGTHKIFRGGGSAGDDTADWCRSAIRGGTYSNHTSSSVGFRLVCEV